MADGTYDSSLIPAAWFDADIAEGAWFDRMLAFDPFSFVPAGLGSTGKIIFCDYESGGKVTYRYNTDVIPSRIGLERRLIIYDYPQRTYEFTTLLDDNQSRDIRTNLFKNMAAAQPFQITMPWAGLGLQSISGNKITVNSAWFADWVMVSNKILIVNPDGTLVPATIQSNLDTSPTSAAAVAAGIGWGTFDHGWQFQEASGALAPAFGGIALPDNTTGLQKYQISGPRGTDFGLGFISNIGGWGNVALFDVAGGDDLIFAAVVKFDVAPTLATYGNLFGKVASAFPNGWAASGTGGGSYGLFTVPGSAFVDNTLDPDFYMLGQWHVVIGAVDRATGKVVFGIRSLVTGKTILGYQATIGAASLSTAGNFDVGQTEWVGANLAQINRLYIGKSVGAAVGITANLATALANFAAMVRPPTDTLTLDVNVTLSAKVGAIVMPLEQVYFAADQQIGVYPVNLESWMLRGDSSVRDPAIGTIGRGTYLYPYFSTFYNDKYPVWDQPLSANNSLVSNAVQSYTEVEDGGGKFAVGQVRAISDVLRQINMTVKSDERRQWLRLFFHTCKGMGLPFWLPTWRDDLLKVTNMVAGQMTIYGPPTLGAGDYATQWFTSNSHRHLQLLLTDGTVRYKLVSGVIDNGNGTQTITFSDIDTQAIQKISFLELCRFDSDELVINWSGYIATTSLMARTVER